MFFGSLCNLYISAQNKIIFSYDNNGNRIGRKICLSAARKVKNLKNVSNNGPNKKDVCYISCNSSRNIEICMDYVFKNPFSVKIYSSSGQIVYTSFVRGKYFVADFSKYPSGAYLVVIENEEIKSAKKLFIK